MRRFVQAALVLSAVAALAGGAAGALHVNKLPPTIKLVSPKSGATVSSAAVTVTVNVTDRDSPVKKVTIGGVTAKAGKAGAYSAVVRLKTGSNKLAITASDGLHTANASLTIVRAVAFSAKFEGQAAVKQSGSAINILVSGVSGSGTPIGSATLDGQGVGNSNAKPCPTFGGDGSMTAGSDKLAFHVNETSTGCPDENDQNQITLKGTANVTGGSGKYAKAKGTLSFNGTFDRSSGSMSVTFSGSLSL